MWALVCRVISEMELAWLFCSCTWGGSLEPDGTEFLEPKCSVLGLCRSVASVASIKHGFWEPWPEATMVPAPWPRPLPGLQGLQELTVDLSENNMGPGAQWVPLEACRGGGGLRVVSKGELRKGSRWFRSASGDWRCPTKLPEA